MRKDQEDSFAVGGIAFHTQEANDKTNNNTKSE
jgi:hypothetical protein